MRAHEAGALHADLGARGPGWLTRPDDVNSLQPRLWSVTARKNSDGALEVGGVDVRALVAEHGSPAYVLDEADFRARAAAFRDAFAGYSVYYAGKAFLCTTVARWVAQEGLNLDVCTGGELAVALRAGFDPARIGYHGNNKSLAELRRAVDAGVGRIVVDSFAEIDRLGAVTERQRRKAGVLVRVTAGVEAHTHEYIATAHEDQKFGFSITSGDAMSAVRQVRETPGLELAGLHSHIGSQIFDTSGFEVAARRVLALHARIADELGVELPELDLGGGFGVAYTSQDDPADPAQLAGELTAIVEQECRRFGVATPALSIEPGRSVVGPSMCTVYQVGTVKPVALDAGAMRTYVSVDGGMSDNIRTALYDADYSCTLASRRSEATPVLARVVGKHCEAGDIVVKDEFVPGDLRAGDLLAVPGTGAYCRSMASNYNHQPRPPVVAVADGRTRVIVRRETEEDVLRTDVDHEARRTGAMTTQTAAKREPEAPLVGSARVMRPLRLAMLGCGAVGSQVVRLLQEQAEDLTARVGSPIELVGVAVRRPELQRHPAVPVDLLTGDARGLVGRGDLDLVIEVIGGIEPARELILTALENGASVVTANKALLAEDGSTLFAAANKAGRDLYYEAAVAGAIPILRPLRESLAGDKVRRVLGIVNGTTNYILDKMDSTGAGFADALEEAQELGYAEADPTADVEGFDAAAKAAILASLAFHTRVTAADVHREGIGEVSAADVASAREMGCVVKLLAICELVDRGSGPAVSVRVHPAMIPRDHPLASVREAYNAVFVESEAAGQLMFYGPGAGGAPTASAVLGDLVTVGRNRRDDVRGGGESTYAQYDLLPMGEAKTRYHVAIDVDDRAGVLAQVASAFAGHGVSISTVRQEGRGRDAKLVVVSHVARDADLAATVQTLRTMDIVHDISSVMRVEGGPE